MTASSDRPAGLLRLDGLRRRAPILALAVALPAVVGTLLATGGRWWWVFELFTHFRVHYLVLLVFGAACLAAMKRWWPAAIVAGFAAWNFAIIVSLYVPATAPATNGRTVRLMLANVHIHNPQHERFLQLVREESPDVVLVLEVGRAWGKSLESLAADYPFRLDRIREDSFGIALYSRLKLEDSEVREIGPAEVPSILARVDCGNGTRVQLLGTHPLPPISGEYASLRNEQLRAAGHVANSLPRPTVLLGDLNITSWSPWFGDIVEESSLRDSRQGFGVQPTWPGSAAWYGIPIDHVLVSPEVVIQQRRVGPDIGSDHRPVIIDLFVTDQE
jgi:endonuclease/exonuclease/phosphatase (EEP) superfamily protein YafD